MFLLFSIQHLVESGIVQFKLLEFLPDAEICPLNLGSTERKLRNTDLILTYVIVGAGLAIATTVFLSEIGWRIFVRSKSNMNFQRTETSKPIYRGQDKTKYVKRQNLETITPPPDYQSLFKPPLYYDPRHAHRKKINGRDYWVLNGDKSFPGLVPLRAPSALLFQYTN